MLGIAIGVHEHDRHRLDAVGERAFERGARVGEIELFFHRAVGAYALVGSRRRARTAFPA